jgi:hypothetical protein
MADGAPQTRSGTAEFGWLALLDEPVSGAVPVWAADGGTATGVAGSASGYLLVTRGRAKPHRSAVRVEPDLVGDGPAWAVSLVLPPRGTRPLFDDPAVVGAMQAVLRDPGRAPLLSTLVDGSTQWAGSVSGIDPDVAAGRTAWWREDPFARLGPQHRILVPTGVFRPAPTPAGPGHQRHAGAPWPWGRFAGSVQPS